MTVYAAPLRIKAGRVKMGFPLRDQLVLACLEEVPQYMRIVMRKWTLEERAKQAEL